MNSFAICLDDCANLWMILLTETVMSLSTLIIIKESRFSCPSILRNRFLNNFEFWKNSHISLVCMAMTTQLCKQHTNLWIRCSASYICEYQLALMPAFSVPFSFQHQFFVYVGPCLKNNIQCIIFQTWYGILYTCMIKNNNSLLLYYVINFTDQTFLSLFLNIQI